MRKILFGVLAMAAALGASAAQQTNDVSHTTIRYRTGSALSFDSTVSLIDEDAGWSIPTTKFLSLSRLLGTQTGALNLGSSSRAATDQDISIGANAYANGENATAVGEASVAVAVGASAFGAEAKATNDQSTAIGTAAVANKNSATALGDRASATHVGSTAIGQQAATTANFQVRLGTASETVSIPGSATIGGTLTINGAGLTNLSTLWALDNLGFQTNGVIQTKNLGGAAGVQMVVGTDNISFLETNQVLAIGQGSWNHGFGFAGQSGRFSIDGGALMLGTNAPANWPTAPASGGGAALVNSNGTVYLLTSLPYTSTWAATNKLAP